MVGGARGSGAIEGRHTWSGGRRGNACEEETEEGAQRKKPMKACGGHAIDLSRDGSRDRWSI
jgi:hypothetical protein